MKHILFIMAFCLSLTNAFAQNETIDLITFKAPDGWKKESNDAQISYSTVDKAKGAWCRISIYKSVPSKGSIDADLEKEWMDLAANPYKITDTMQVTQTEEADGWKVKVASGKFSFNKKPAAAMLTTFSGYNRCASILAVTNSQQYLDSIQNFIAAIDITKPVGENLLQNNTAPAISGFFTFSTTNFDDGWTSTVYDDYVLTSKGTIKVYLSYIEKFNESHFAGTGLEKRHHYWDSYVSKLFITGDKKFDRGGALSDFSADFIEGWATDKQTGEKRYIGMILNIIAFTGRLSVIIASAADEQEFRKQFPKADSKFYNDLLPMYSYNKFAVGKNDLTGKWSSNGGGTMSWYSTITGEYAGATGSVSSDVFNFNADGSYTSEHKGGYGVVGAMTTYQQKYKGTYAVSLWTATATRRWDGKTEKFDAWFEIVKGGRMLHLVNRSVDMTLFKEK